MDNLGEPLLDDLEEPLLQLEVAAVVQGLSDDGFSRQEEEEEIVSSPSCSYKARWVLLFVSFLFATLNVSLRSLYSMPHPLSPAQVNVVRGVFTVLFFLPFLAARSRRKGGTSPEEDAIIHTSTITNHRPLWMAAAELAFWNAAGQVLTNYGLLTIPSARASFLGQTVVVFVPLLSALGGARMSRKSCVGCLSSTLGVVLLSCKDHNDDKAVQLQNVLQAGDSWMLASALCFSIYLIRITQLAPHYDEVFLQGTKNAFMAVLYAVWWFLDVYPHFSMANLHWAALLLIVYTAFGPGALADVLQQTAQKVVPATESNLILCTSSVFTALLARLMLGEETSFVEKVGGAFLVMGAAVAGGGTELSATTIEEDL